jgi:hypothetical protein
MRFPLLVALACLLLSACDQNATPEAQAPAPVVAVAEPDASQQAAPEPATAPVAPVASSQPGVVFTIEQVTSDCNPETPYRARLYWKIDDPAKASIVVRAESTSSMDMATHDAQEETAETEDWVREGMPFYLIERTSGEVLATVTAGPENCR